MSDTPRLHVVAFGRNKHVELVGGGHVGFVACLVQRPCRHGRLQKRGPRHVRHHQMPRRVVALGQPHESVAPPPRVGRHRAAGLAGHRHRSELHQEAVPGLLLMGLQRLEAEDVVLGEPVQDLGQGVALHRFVRQANPKERVVEKRVLHGERGRGAKRNSQGKACQRVAQRSTKIQSCCVRADALCPGCYCSIICTRSSGWYGVSEVFSKSASLLVATTDAPAAAPAAAR